MTALGTASRSITDFWRQTRSLADDPFSDTYRTWSAYRKVAFLVI
jgi:hypothetical protein